MQMCSNRFSIVHHRCRRTKKKNRFVRGAHEPHEPSTSRQLYIFHLLLALFSFCSLSMQEMLGDSATEGIGRASIILDEKCRYWYTESMPVNGSNSVNNLESIESKTNSRDRDECLWRALSCQSKHFSRNGIWRNWAKLRFVTIQVRGSKKGSKANKLILVECWERIKIAKIVIRLPSRKQEHKIPASYRLNQFIRVFQLATLLCHMICIIFVSVAKYEKNNNNSRKINKHCTNNTNH